MTEFSWPLAGAFAFGLVLGWNVYFVNRYRKGEVSFGDLTTLIGVVGGAAVVGLFRKADLFGAYSLGLAVGFFAYFAMLGWLVSKSDNFDADWFLDGRRRNPAEGLGYGSETRPTVTAMALPPASAAPVAPTVALNFHGANPGEARMISFGGEGERESAQLAAPNPDAIRIQQVCIATWSASGPQGPFKAACNFFVIEVASGLGIALAGTADQITERLKTDPTWTRLADGKAARDAAAQGKLVFAGVKSDAYDPPRNEGHAAIVVAGPMNPGGWAPAGYWGSTDPHIASLGGSGAPISQCFTAAVKDAIVYRCRDI